MIKILHLDDDPLVLMKVESALLNHSFGLNIAYEGAQTPKAFHKKFKDSRPDCILLDLILGPEDLQGNAILAKLRQNNFQGPIVILSHVATMEDITDAVEKGASDFITKGLEDVELSHRITHVIKPHSTLIKEPNIPATVFAGKTARTIFNKIPKFLRSKIRSILVTGDSGTGKEVVACIIKSFLSPNQPFIPLNCAAIAQDLIESELFGHEKGSFTGATTKKEGLFTKADGGWIFLDELGRLSYQAQSALLRTLETFEVRPVGSTIAHKVDVRVIAATNENLEDMVEKGTFRQDLLERLRAYEIELPPLSEREMEEVEEILDHLMCRLNSQVGYVDKDETIYQLPAESRKLLLAHTWRNGNIREMWNTLQSMSVETTSEYLSVATFPKSFRKQLASITSRATSLSTEKTKQNKIKRERIEIPTSLPELEKALFLNCLDALTKKYSSDLPSMTKISADLGLSRWTLKAKFEKLNSENLLPSPFLIYIQNS